MIVGHLGTASREASPVQDVGHDDRSAETGVRVIVHQTMLHQVPQGKSQLLADNRCDLLIGWRGESVVVGIRGIVGVIGSFAGHFLCHGEKAINSQLQPRSQVSPVTSFTRLLQDVALKLLLAAAPVAAKLCERNHVQQSHDSFDHFDRLLRVSCSGLWLTPFGLSFSLGCDHVAVRVDAGLRVTVQRTIARAPAVGSSALSFAEARSATRLQVLDEALQVCDLRLQLLD